MRHVGYGANGLAPACLHCLWRRHSDLGLASPLTFGSVERLCRGGRLPCMPPCARAGWLAHKPMIATMIISLIVWMTAGLAFRWFVFLHTCPACLSSAWATRKAICLNAMFSETGHPVFEIRSYCP